jgi:putative transposase
MNIEKGNLYHIYNQGNNGRKIFFSRENYLFFKEKIRVHIIPFADIIAWCLMPNHFHLMLYVREEKNLLKESNKMRRLNDSIGILLRSYARAINKQENMSGSLFRKETKAKCLTCSDLKEPNYFNTKFGIKINSLNQRRQYPQICFNYIHHNPIDSGIAHKLEDWEFSSIHEYRNPTIISLVNIERAKQFVSLESVN